MKSRGFRLVRTATSGVWVGEDEVETTGDDVVVPWTSEPSLTLLGNSVYQVIAWGSWWVDAASGGAEGQIEIGQDGTAWATVDVAHDLDGTARRPWRATAWLRTGPAKATISPVVTARLTGSSSGAATLHVGAGAETPMGLIARRVNLPQSINGIDLVAVAV